jgi:hypothetical protein
VSATCTVTGEPCAYARFTAADYERTHDKWTEPYGALVTMDPNARRMLQEEPDRVIGVACANCGGGIQREITDALTEEGLQVDLPGAAEIGPWPEDRLVRAIHNSDREGFWVELADG